MWLPKDERKTLRKYHSYIHNIDESKRFTGLSEMLYNTTRNLIERGLILEIKEHSNAKNQDEYMFTTLKESPVNLQNFLSLPEDDEKIRQEVVLKFTLKGLDLARKYDNWFTRTGLCFAEYKDHWFWLILSFLGGIIGALLVNWLSSLFTKSSGC